VQKGTSALPSIATAKADSRKQSCPLYPPKRTCAVQLAMSAKGQKRTFSLVVTPARNHPIFAQRTPNQISEMKMVSTDMPVEMTTAGDTVLKYTLYC
jgi:hypothetical protein